MRGVCAIVAAMLLLTAAVAFAYDRDDTYKGTTNTGRGVNAEIRGDHVRFFEGEVRVQCSDGSSISWLANTDKKHPTVVGGDWSVTVHPQQTPAWTVHITGHLRRHRKRMVGSFSVKRPPHNGVTCSAQRSYKTHRVSSQSLG